ILTASGADRTMRWPANDPKATSTTVSYWASRYEIASTSALCKVMAVLRHHPDVKPLRSSPEFLVGCDFANSRFAVVTSRCSGGASEYKRVESADAADPDAGARYLKLTAKTCRGGWCCAQCQADSSPGPYNRRNTSPSRF